MPQWPPTSKSLLQRLADPSDAASWDEFERVYAPTVYRYLRNHGIQTADAEDALQEVLIAVHKQAAMWQPSGRAGSFRAWLAETVRRTTLQFARMRDRSESEGTAFHAKLDQLARVESAGTEEEERRWLFCLAASEVEAVTASVQWRAFWRTAVDGATPTAVAQELGMSLGAVYTARSRVQSRIIAFIRSARAESPRDA